MAKDKPTIVHATPADVTYEFDVVTIQFHPSYNGERTTPWLIFGTTGIVPITNPERFGSQWNTKKTREAYIREFVRHRNEMMEVI